MSSAREAFLNRVRQAVAEGNRAGTVPPLPERGAVGYQGAGADPVARLGEELRAAGGVLYSVKDEAEVAAVVLKLVGERSARRVLLGEGARLDALALESALRSIGVEVVRPVAREAVFAADVGISGVDRVIAETGTLVLATRPEQPRSLSLLPPVHIAIAWRDQVIADLFDLFPPNNPALPACLQLITGPSKTGDIELKLVTGVHGPGEVYLVLVG